MNEKKYAIVRVDNKCPDQLEKIDLDYICRNISCYQGKECSKKFYGDTKEQLIKKVAQASINYYESRPFSKVNFQDMARWIVEFLGVEE